MSLTRLFSYDPNFDFKLDIDYRMTGAYSYRSRDRVLVNYFPRELAIITKVMLFIEFSTIK